MTRGPRLQAASPDLAGLRAGPPGRRPRLRALGVGHRSTLRGQCGASQERCRPAVGCADARHSDCGPAARPRDRQPAGEPACRRPGDDRRSAPGQQAQTAARPSRADRHRCRWAAALERDARLERENGRRDPGVQDRGRLHAGTHRGRFPQRHHRSHARRGARKT